jgi:hypothetical protein
MALTHCMCRIFSNPYLHVKRIQGSRSAPEVRRIPHPFRIRPRAFPVSDLYTVERFQGEDEGLGGRIFMPLCLDRHVQLVDECQTRER